MTRQYFSNVSNLDELRKEYRKLLKKYHPDNVGGSEEATKAINKEYEEIFNELKNGSESEGIHFENDFNSKFDEKIREALAKIINLEGIEIEICGSWIWVGGNTYPVKDTLKAAGFKFSKNKTKWYFNPDPEWKRGRKGSTPMQDIRMNYGSVSIKGKPGNGPKKLTEK